MRIKKFINSLQRNKKQSHFLLNNCIISIIRGHLQTKRDVPNETSLRNTI